MAAISSTAGIALLASNKVSSLSEVKELIETLLWTESRLGNRVAVGTTTGCAVGVGVTVGWGAIGAAAGAEDDPCVYQTL